MEEGGETPIETPGDDTSLFSDGTPAPVEVEPQEPQAPVAERPDYIMEQHWDAESGEVRVESMAKSLKDTKGSLDKKRDDSGVPTLSEGYYKVDESGNLFLPEGLDNIGSIPSNDAFLNVMAKAAHDSDMTKTQWDAQMGAYYEYMNGEIGRTVYDPDAVLNDINPDRLAATNTVSGVNTYLNQVNDMNDSELAAVQSLMSTSGGVTLMAKLMGVTGQRAIPLGVQSVPTPDNTAAQARWDELRLNPALRDNNPALQLEMEALNKQLRG